MANLGLELALSSERCTFDYLNRTWRQVVRVPRLQAEVLVERGFNENEMVNRHDVHLDINADQMDLRSQL